MNIHVIVYGKGEITYDISAMCTQCGGRHVARFPLGQTILQQAACPYCGIGDGTLRYGNRATAAAWMREPGRPTCIRCGYHLKMRTDTYCDDCWQDLFLHAVLRSKAAINPFARQFRGIPISAQLFKESP